MTPTTLAADAAQALQDVTEGPWAYEYTRIGHTVRQPGAYNAIFTVNHAGSYEPDARFIAFARAIMQEAAARLSALTAQSETWRRNSRETFDAMCAMRNSINEHLPLPSLESDLLQGPGNSVFCAAVAEAVVSKVSRLRDRLARMEGALRYCEQAPLSGWTIAQGVARATLTETPADGGKHE